MTARALIKSPTAQRSSPSSTSPGGSTPQLPNQSVQADGMRDRLPSGSTTNNNGTPCRVSPLITARRHPSKGCRLRVMTTEVGKSWEWVVCGVFVRHHRPRETPKIPRPASDGRRRPKDDRQMVEGGGARQGRSHAHDGRHAPRRRDHSPNAKGNFCFDRVMPLDRSQVVLDLRLKR